MSEPDRPASLPAHARWLPDVGEFIVCGQVDGLDHGEARYYRPDGTLAEVAQLVYGVFHGPYERTHPDGTWSHRGTMRHGLRHGELSWRRTDTPTPTAELTVPAVCPPEIRESRAVCVDGVAGPVRFWDADGVERMHTGERLPARPATVPADAAFEPNDRVWFHGIGSQGYDQRHGWWRWWTEAGVPTIEKRYWRGKELESRDYDGAVVVRYVRAGPHGVIRQRRVDGHDVDFAGQPLPERPTGIPDGARFDLDSGGWVEGPDLDWVASEEVELAPCSGRYVWWTGAGVRDHERVFVDGTCVYDRGYFSSGAPMVDRVYDADGNELSETWWDDDRVESREERSFDEQGVRAAKIRTEQGETFVGVRDGDGMRWTFRDRERVVAEGRVVGGKAVGRWSFVEGDARYVLELDGKVRAHVDKDFDPSWILGRALREREGSGPRIALLDGVDAVDWSDVEGAFSSDVKRFPALLQAMTSPIAAVRSSAFGAIRGEIEHQGSIYPATAEVMPFLLRLLGHPNVDVDEVLGTLVYVVEWAAGRGEEEGEGEDWDEDEDSDEDAGLPAPRRGGDDDDDEDADEDADADDADADDDDDEGNDDEGDDDDEDDDDDDWNPYLQAATDTVQAVADGFAHVAAHLQAHTEPVLSLAAHGGEAGRALLRDAVSHPDAAVAAVAVHGLVGRKDTDPDDVLTWLAHPDPLVRVCVALPAALRFRAETPEAVLDVLLAALHAEGDLEGRYRSLPFVDGRLVGAVAVALAQVRTPRALAAAPALAADLDRLDLWTLDTVTTALFALCFGDATGPFAPAFLEVLDRLGACGTLRGFANFTRTASRWNLPSHPDELRALAAELRAAPDAEAALRARMLGA